MSNVATAEQRPASAKPAFDPELSLTDVTCPLEWKALFGREAPVEVDIGCGKGRFLIEAAQKYPERNYLGIEKVGKPFRLAKERIGKRSLRNIRLVRADAREFIGERIADGTVSVYHVLFPDPWPKKRHHKRRIVTPAFVEQLARTLRPGGHLHIATDIADYFEELLLVIESVGRFDVIEEGLYDETRDLMTNFAAKYIREGRGLYYARLRLERDGPSYQIDSR